MSIEVGQTIKRKKDTVKVLTIGSSLIQILDSDGRDFWVKRSELESGVVVPALGTAGIPTLVPVVEKLQEDIAVVRIEPLLVPHVTKLRIVYPEKSQAYLNEQVGKHGVILDPRTRPVRPGIRGGTTIQRSPAATVEFSVSTPVSLLPTPVYAVVDKKGKQTGYRVNSIALAFALLKAGAKQTAFA